QLDSASLYMPGNSITSALANEFAEAESGLHVAALMELGLILFMFVWTIILCSYLVYRKKRPHLHEKSIYKMPLGKLMCWVC
ncbi:hypothetical protein ONJ23_28115, partial [Salmonella enterica subsp. enterica serovar Virginia]|nr:hypothetical protein [Salmonella enterica subsp. enterica serovar Virginia]